MEHRDTAQALCTVAVLIQDVAASWASYQELVSVFDPLPEGLLFHLAGPTDEGIRLVSASRSASDGQGFQEQRLEPALRRSLHRQPVISLRELRVAHLTDSHAPSTRVEPIGKGEVMKRSNIPATAANWWRWCRNPPVLAIAAMLALAVVAGIVAAPASAADPVVVNLSQCFDDGGTATVPAGVPVQLRLPGYAQGTRGLITDFLLKEHTSLTLDSAGTSTVTDLTGTWSTPQQLDTHLWVTREPNFHLGSFTSGQTVTVTWAVTFAHPLLVAFPPVGPSGDNGPYLIKGEGPISCQITA